MLLSSAGRVIFGVFRQWRTGSVLAHRSSRHYKPEIPATFESPKFQLDQRFLNVQWSTYDEETYPLVWLRNNCQCSSCYHPVSGDRKILGRHLQLDPKIEAVTTDPDSRLLNVMWTDGHNSTFEFDWLIERGFSEQRRAKRWTEVFGFQMRRAWGREFQPQALDFSETVDSDQGMLRLLTLLKVYGLCILKNAEGEEKPLNELTRRLGYTQPTNYGHTFEVKNKADPSNLAYTSDTLGLHNDLTFYYTTPGIQLLHCVRQTSDIEGGENFFADSMFAGRRIKREDRKAFELLVNEYTSTWNYGSDYVPEYHLRNIRPTLRVDENEEVVEIAYSHASRDSRMVIAPEKMPDWYRALFLLENVMMEEAVYWKLKPGEIACMDNTRVLHGRNAYKATNPDAERYLRGAYYCWDETNSIFRRLKEKCGEV